MKLEDEYKRLLGIGKVTIADVAEDRFLRHMQATNIHHGNQEDDPLIGLFEDPHMLRNSLLAEWMPFIEDKPESKGRFPLPEYRIGPNRRIK